MVRLIHSSSTAPLNRQHALPMSDVDPEKGSKRGDQLRYQRSDTMCKLIPVLDQLNSQNCLKNMQENLKKGNLID